MVENKRKDDWCCDGETVKGASHVRTGLNNQDAIRWWPDWPKFGLGPPLILAVSDGHGSAKSFRSHIGAELAVKLATEVLGKYLKLHEQPDELNANFSMSNDMVQIQLPKTLVKRWREAVKKELEKEPFRSEEWASLEKKDDPAAQKAVEENPTLAYGATLLAVVVAEHFILYLQLGDGDILCVDTYGKTTRPFTRDEKLIANETTSLCMPNAWQEVRVSLVPYSENPPALILVSTDGYSNSFRSESDFLKIGQDYLKRIQSEGIDNVQKQLTSFLEESSQQGSGDDITLGIIKRIEKGDVDYKESDFSTKAKEREELHNQVEEPMTKRKRQQRISDDDGHNKLIKDVERLQLYGLSVSFFFTVLVIGSIGADIWLFYQIRHNKSTQPVSSKAESPTPPTASPSSQKPDSANKPKESPSAAQTHNEVNSSSQQNP